ncbi:MAG: hypothetical protein NC094_06140 [Bacteroidales bacterium]|nr:hypothetical protein [Lachnoclostridium sp.]MCM1383319.1 hypothetical protein [Lachnoclostridium sp.]MCM1464983.1 hypothetical protein [Bacteroidales bacterium]
MDTKKLEESEKERKLLIEELRERLNFYTFQASDEQFDAQRVEMLTKKIRELELQGIGTGQEKSEAEVSDQVSFKAAEADFEAFQKYRAEKEADALHLAALGGVSADEADQKRSALNGKWAGSRRLARAAVIGAAVLLAVGGGIGVVNAQKDGGLLRWLKKDAEGEVILVEPDRESPNQAGFAKDRTTAYDSAEELPEEYRKYFVDVTGIKGLEGYEQGQVLLRENQESWDIDSSWVNPSQEPLLFEVGGIKDSVVIWDKRFDEFEELFTKEVGGIELSVCRKQNDAGEPDVVVRFFYENRSYTVYGNGELSTEEMELLATGYLERVLEKNKDF